MKATNQLLKFCGIFKIPSPENKHCVQRFSDDMHHAQGWKVTSKTSSKEVARVAQWFYFSLMIQDSQA